MPKKKTKTKISKEAVDESLKKPEIVEGQYSFCMTIDEVLSMVQVLSFSKEMFNQLSINFLKDGDEKNAAMYAARSELSSLLYKKIREVASIGEPASRNIH